MSDEPDSLFENPYTRGPAPKPAAGARPAQLPLLLVSAAAALGALFAAISTSDFINHLDRQMHSIHCSFIPGAAAQVGESGCRTIMMSPYSSLFRDAMWGGLPISMLALAVFAYLIMRGITFGLSGHTTKKETSFLIAATGLPLLMSVIYGYIAAVEIDAVCKLCVGIYVASTLGFAFAIWAHIKAPPARRFQSPWGSYAQWFFEGVLYVSVIAVMYVLFMPQSDVGANGCGTLAKKDDPSKIFVPLGTGNGPPGIAVLDPLCPACKGFDKRMQASGLYRELSLQGVLFPLDSRCNWMVEESLHPGACTVSEAMLCDKDAAEDVLDWAFENQAHLRELAEEDEGKLRAAVVEKFPAVKGCLNSARIRNKVNKSLRWAVANALPVLTPQLFVDGKRVCDQDTDLGLEYAVARMLSGEVDDTPKKKRRR